MGTQFSLPIHLPVAATLCASEYIYRTVTLSGVNFIRARKKTEHFIVSTDISAVRWNDFFVSFFPFAGPFPSHRLKKNTLKLKEACIQWVSLWHSAHAVRYARR